MARGTQWNAMSHAANHGYSHLSGIDSTSPAAKWRQLWLRPFLRSSGGGVPALSPSSQRLTM